MNERLKLIAARLEEMRFSELCERSDTQRYKWRRRYEGWRHGCAGRSLPSTPQPPIRSSRKHRELDRGSSSTAPSPKALMVLARYPTDRVSCLPVRWASCSKRVRTWYIEVTTDAGPSEALACSARYTPTISNDVRRSRPAQPLQASIEHGASGRRASFESRIART